jgi:hypothetical protein
VIPLLLEHIVANEVIPLLLKQMHDCLRPFPATLVLKTMTAHKSPLYFRTVGGQENHVQGALLIGSGVVRE